MKTTGHAIMTENYDVSCGGWVGLAPTPIYVRNFGGRDNLFVRYSYYHDNGEINEAIESRQHSQIGYYFIEVNVDELNKI